MSDAITTDPTLDDVLGLVRDVYAEDDPWGQRLMLGLVARVAGLQASRLNSPPLKERANALAVALDERGGPKVEDNAEA